MTPHDNGHSGGRPTRRHGRSLARSAVIGSIALAVALIPAGPASATVHEIVAQWCSGHEPLEPRGISGGSAADNFAQPLNSNGFIQGTVPFDPDGPAGPAAPGLLVNFNYDHPAAKVVGTGVYVLIDPEVPLYLELIEPDPRFPAFQRCPRLVTG
jgi:hypothetical protein